MRLILLGAPGAGKGTQAKALAKELSLPHISTGDILRKNVADSTELGKKAKNYMNKGELVPDAIVIGMLLDRLAEADTDKGFILDGFPRNLNQAKALDTMLTERNKQIDLVINLEVSEPVVITRLSGRLICSKCQAIYHKKNNPPQNDMVCDKCGGALYQRDDDKEETVRKRLEVYREEAQPLLDFYNDRGILLNVSADEEAGVVLDEIIRMLTSYNDSRKN